LHVDHDNGKVFSYFTWNKIQSLDDKEEDDRFDFPGMARWCLDEYSLVFGAAQDRSRRRPNYGVPYRVFSARWKDGIVFRVLDLWCCNYRDLFADKKKLQEADEGLNFEILFN